MKTTSLTRFALALFLGFLCLAGVSLAEGKTTTVKGEVLDLACYLAHGGQGAQHQTCALKCLKGGQPMGLKASDGTVYLLTASHEDPSPYEKAKTFAGQVVTVQGEMFTRSGMKALEVASVKKG